MREVLLADGVVDAVEVDPVVLGDHVELVRDRELAVAPDVGEQLAQLGFEGGEADGLASQAREEPFHLLRGGVVEGGDDLRQHGEFLEGLALRDALRAEGHVDVASRSREEVADELGGAGEDRAAQHQELPVHHVGADLLEEVHDDVEAGVEVVVHGGPDDHADDACLVDAPGVAADVQVAAGVGGGQGLLATLFQEGHLAGAHHLGDLLVAVADQGPHPVVREHDGQGKPHVAQSANDTQIVLHGWSASLNLGSERAAPGLGVPCGTAVH